MCGIAGFAAGVHPLSQGRPILDAMVASLTHRGPDEDGFYVDEHAALGARRLSVIDVVGGHQPAHSEDGGVQVVYNGEIYNFAALRDGLIGRGHTFTSRSDTEVIAHAYEEYGTDCPRHFNGMFAFAVWDAPRRQLFLARDRLGIKPLYYCVTGDTLVFASEPKAILCYPAITRRLDVAALDQYLTYEYVPGRRSIFAGIRRLLGGESLLWDGQNARRERYWSVPLQDGLACRRGMDDMAQELEHRLRQSVQAMLVSDVPLGVFLSGGIDSSLVTAIMSMLAPGQVKTFSVGFADRSFDESPYARQVADLFGTHHHVETLEASDLSALLPAILDVLDEPFGDASIVPTYVLSRMTRRHVTVALSGEGGDELFAGYPTYAATRLAGWVNALPRPLVAGLRRGVEMLPVQTSNLSLDFRLKRFFSRIHLQAPQRHVLWMGSFTPQEKGSLYAADVRAQVEALDALWEPLRVHGLDAGWSGDEVGHALRMDLALYLADDLLVKLDRASMASSLEGRVPYLDHELVEFALRVPTSMKLAGLKSKQILKRVARTYLPEDIVRRSKKGFGIPVARWIKGPLHEFIHDHFARGARSGLFEEKYLRRLLREHDDGVHDHRKLIWTLLMFFLWQDRWL